jgi:hypothetical protein
MTQKTTTWNYIDMSTSSPSSVSFIIQLFLHSLNSVFWWKKNVTTTVLGTKLLLPVMWAALQGAHALTITLTRPLTYCHFQRSKWVWNLFSYIKKTRKDSEKRVLRRILRTERERGTGGSRKMHNTNLCKLYNSANIMRVVKSRKISLDRYAVCMGETIQS